MVYCNIYSTFLQRAYDQVIHDVALQNLPIIFCLDRAGIVGEDGATHHGVFDIAYLRCIPNMMIAAPRDEVQLRNLLFTVQKDLQGPIAIRYPRGRGIRTDWQQEFKLVEYGRGECLKKGSRVAVISCGSIYKNVKKSIENLDKKDWVAHYDAGFVKPLDITLFEDIFNNFAKIVTVEDGVIAGGFGSAVLELASLKNYKGEIRCLGVPDEFIEQGSVDELYEIAKIDVQHITTTITELF